MKMQLARNLAVAALLGGSLSACDSLLGVTNINQPELERVFATPQGVEQTIGTGYQSVHNALANNDLMPELLTLSVESFSGLNNFNMGVRVAIPRSPIANATGAPSIFDDYSNLARGGRLAANALNALDTLIANDPTPANGVLGPDGEDARTRAFAFFTIGAHQGWIAMVYDSASIITNEALAVDEFPPLSGRHEVMAAAIAMFDSAEAIAENAADFADIPDGWVGGFWEDVDDDAFLTLVRSYRARFRAGVARTPEERADISEGGVVDWEAVRDDALNGIEENFMVMARGSTGWNIGFVGSQMFANGRAWSQISLLYYGMADTSVADDGRFNYEAWLNTPLGARSPFLVRTPDRRWPRGETRSAQADATPQPTGITSKPYIDASPSNEISLPWGWSYYQSWRNRYIRNTSDANPWPEMLKAEIDLLAAEAHLRLGEIPQAIAIIDEYRLANDLPSLAGLTSINDPVPGADYVIAADRSITSVTPNPAKSNCVPRVPVPLGGGGYTTACGSLWEAMKYEKRMETAYSSYGRWYFDGRGWGDLVENTNTEYPVPFEEMDARELTSYPLGGGLASSTARGTYGF